MYSWPFGAAPKPISAATVLECHVRAVYENMLDDRINERQWENESGITLSDLKGVRGRTGAIWHLREIEMDKRQAERDAYVLRYRPIRTFTPEERAARLQTTYDNLVEMGILVRTSWVRSMKPW